MQQSPGYSRRIGDLVFQTAFFFTWPINSVESSRRRRSANRKPIPALGIDNRRLVKCVHLFAHAFVHRSFGVTRSKHLLVADDLWLCAERRNDVREVIQTWISSVRKVSDPGGSVIERVSGSQNHGAFCLPPPSLVTYPCYLPHRVELPHRRPPTAPALRHLPVG